MQYAKMSSMLFRLGSPLALSLAVHFVEATGTGHKPRQVPALTSHSYQAPDLNPSDLCDIYEIEVSKDDNLKVLHLVTGTH